MKVITITPADIGELSKDELLRTSLLLGEPIGPFGALQPGALVHVVPSIRMAYIDELDNIWDGKAQVAIHGLVAERVTGAP